MPSTFGSNTPVSTNTYPSESTQARDQELHKATDLGVLTTNISDLAKKSTITPMSFVSVIPLSPTTCFHSSSPTNVTTKPVRLMPLHKKKKKIAMEKLKNVASSK